MECPTLGQDPQQKWKAPATPLSPRSGSITKDKGAGKGKGRGGRSEKKMKMAAHPWNRAA